MKKYEIILSENKILDCHFLQLQTGFKPIKNDKFNLIESTIGFIKLRFYN